VLASQSGRIVEGAAGLADSGGVLSGLKGLFVSQAPSNFASAVERSGVTPAGLGAGYVVFFTYSALIGLFALVLSIMLVRRNRDADQRAAAPRRT